MRPLVLHGHMKAVAMVKYNVEGDLLFSCAREHDVLVWHTEKKQLLGKYKGHDGVVDGVAVSHDTQRLATAGAEGQWNLWDVESGQCVRVHESEERCPVKSVAFSHGSNLVCSVTKKAYGILPSIVVYDVRSGDPSFSYEYSAPISQAEFGPTNDTVYFSTDDGQQGGSVAILHTGTQRMTLDNYESHVAGVRRFAFFPDYSALVTASQDQSARLFDTATLTQRTVYQTDEPLNAVAVHPTRPHVMVGGGMAAQDVTTQAGRMNRFLTRFYHVVYNKEPIGTLGGHFSPVNSVQYHPQGLGFVTAGEDGFIRMYDFDDEYKRLDDAMEIDADIGGRSAAKEGGAAAAAE
eukprot:TRINITY_DN2936_c0_g1_i1.p1 TRINITY_DN2936_c0_g1~~TRINITY_DN2936_c0_g1_i1.p1  ORF type:complete len:349 (+),score=81.08 TRINITY_DN2936_c0_g1_i1:100-1146(+)